MAKLSRGMWPSKLHEIINEESDDDWSSTIERVRTHPSEVAACGKLHFQTALHSACLRWPPLVAIKAMIEASPETAGKPNKEGETPLHLAMAGASEEVQKLIVDAAPETVAMVDKYGDSPMHMAARSGATFDLLQKFCQISPQAVSLENKNGKTPFWLLPRSYLQASSMAELEEEEKYENDWKCSKLFLSCNLDPGIEFDLAHVAAANPSCPRDLLSFICRICCPPQEATRYNSQGKTPLIMAAMAPVVEEPVEWDEDEDGFREEVDQNENWYDSDNDESDSAEDANAALHNFSNSSNFEQMVESCSTDAESTDPGASKNSVLNILVQWNPRAASMADSDGRLPLAHAICTDKTWKNGIRQLLFAAPRALESRDMQTHLYPFQLAAAHCSDLNAIYCLTRSLPELIAMGISYPATNETASVASSNTKQTTKILHKAAAGKADKADNNSRTATVDNSSKEANYMTKRTTENGNSQDSCKRQRL